MLLFSSYFYNIFAFFTLGTPVDPQLLYKYLRAATARKPSVFSTYNVMSAIFIYDADLEVWNEGRSAFHCYKMYRQTDWATFIMQRLIHLRYLTLILMLYRVEISTSFSHRLVIQFLVAMLESRLLLLDRYIQHPAFSFFSLLSFKPVTETVRSSAHSVEEWTVPF